MVRVKRWCKRPPVSVAISIAMQTPLGARPRRPALENCSFKLAGRLLEFVSNYEPRWMVISLAIARQDPAYRVALLFMANLKNRNA